MALWAAHIFVRPRQWELSAFIVVKRGGCPPLVYMTIPAFCDPVLGHKLAAVRIRMAGFAIRGRSLELNFVGAGKRLVAIPACDRAMGPNQGEFRFGMVKATDVNPRASGVTCFATQCGPIGALCRHSLLEFSLMGIHMAGRAGHIFEMERQDLVCSSAKANLMALRASNSHVGPR